MAPTNFPQKRVAGGKSIVSSRIRKKETSQVKEPAKQAIARICGMKQVRFNDIEVFTRGSNGRLSRDSVVQNTSIHTREWMLAIAPQLKAGLLCLPLELRQKIYRIFLKLHLATISPYKSGQKFTSFYDGDDSYEGNCNLGTTTNKYITLLLVSRQVYADTVFLLYQEKKFHFEDLALLRSYLDFIDPIKSGMISKLNVKLRAPENTSPFPPSFFRALSCLSSLKALTIEVAVHKSICTRAQNATTSPQRPQSRKWRIKNSHLEAWKSERWNILQNLELFCNLSIQMDIGSWWPEDHWARNVLLQEPNVVSFADEVLRMWSLGRYKAEKAKKEVIGGAQAL